MAAGAEGTAWIHADHQSLTVLGRHLQPGGQDQQPVPHRIRLPVLLPAQAPVLIGNIVPSPLWQLHAEGLRQGGQAGQELLALGLRPLRLGQPQQQLLLIRRLRSMLHRMAVQTEVRQFPDQRFLQFRRTRHRQTPPHQRLTG